MDVQGSPVLTTERHTIYSTWQSNYMYGVMCRLHQGDPFTMFIHTGRCLLIRAPCALSCRQSSSPCACISTFHHCHIESTLPHLYKNFAAAFGLYYSTVTKTIGWTTRNFMVTCQWEENDGSHDVTLVLTHDQLKI